MMIFTLCSTLTLVNSSGNAMAANKTEISKPFVMVVKGHDNIEAYKKAGIIRPCGTILGNDTLVQNGIGVKGSQIPTATWDLNSGSRSFTYSISSYIYSNYAYRPNVVDIDIWQNISPNSNQKLRIDCYQKSNNSLKGTFNDYIDDDISIGFGGPNSMDIGHFYYFKYSSPTGNWIAGSGVVY